MINLISALNLTAKISVCIAVFAVLIVLELVSFGLLVKWKKKTKKALIEKAKEDKRNAALANSEPVSDIDLAEESAEVTPVEEKTAEENASQEVAEDNAKDTSKAFAFAPLMLLGIDIPVATLRYILYGMVGLAVVLGIAVFAAALIFEHQIKHGTYDHEEEAPVQTPTLDEIPEELETKEEEQPQEEKLEDEPVPEEEPVEEVAEEPVEEAQPEEEEEAEEEATAEEVEEEPAVEEELVAEEEPAVEEKPVREETVYVVEKPISMFVKPKATEKKETKAREREVVIDNVTYMMRDGRYLFNPEDDGWYIVLTKTFTAKLIQSEDYVKDYYTELKNELLSYKKVHARMSKKRESFNFGRTCLARLSIRGKTLRLHLALDPKDYAETKYIIDDMSETKSLADTPLMYRMKNDRRLKYAKELIAAVMAQVGAVKDDNFESTNYTAMLPYEEDEPLIERDLITRKWYKGRVPDTGFDFAQKTFTAKLIQSDETVKEYYSAVKNHLLSYRKIHERMSKKRETFRFGRVCVARMAIRGKTLRLYLALNPADYVETKYRVEDFSEVKSVADTPLAIKLKNPRRLKYAIELIDDAMVNMGVIQKRDIIHTDYTSDLEYESTEALMEKGLITNVHVKGNSFVAQHFTFKAKAEEEAAADEDNE